MKITRLSGATDQTVLVFIQDSSATDGSGVTGLAAADLTCYYTRVETDNDVTTAALSLSDLSALTDAHTDGGIYEVDSTNSPGLYRLDLSDAILAAGATEAVVCITDAGSNNVPPTYMEIQISAPISLGAIEGTATVDTETLTNFFKYVLAYIKGEQDYSGTAVAYRNQADDTTLWTATKTASERAIT